MTLLSKFLITAIVAVSSIAPAQALTTKDFYSQCAEIPECTEISIPKLLLNLKNRHLSSLKIVDAEKIDSKTRQKVLDQLDQIKTNKETAVIKDTENGEINRIFIEPDGKDMNILIADVEQNELSVIYIRCSQKLVDKIIKEYSNK